MTISGYERTKNGRGAFLALIAQFLGPDVRQLLRRQADTFLEHARYDATSKNFTFDKFTSRMRQAFEDMGPNDQFSEERKVTKLMQAFQVPSMAHLDALVTSNPRYSQSFESTVAFLKDQMTALKTKNEGYKKRQISQVQSVVVDSEIGESESPRKRQRTLAPMGAQKPGKRTTKRAARTFDGRNPSKYLSKAAWDKLTETQKEQARQARRRMGIPSREDKKRNIGSLASGDTTTNKYEEDEVVVVEPPKPNPPVKDNGGMQMICVRRNISMTQRPIGNKDTMSIKSVKKGNKKRKKNGNGGDS